MAEKLKPRPPDPSMFTEEMPIKMPIMGKYESTLDSVTDIISLVPRLSCSTRSLTASFSLSSLPVMYSQGCQVVQAKGRHGRIQ